MFDCLEWLYVDTAHMSSCSPFLSRADQTHQHGNARRSLDWNDFSGTIPLDITEISRLTVLTLSMNNLQGPIPPEIGELIFLVELCVPDIDARLYPFMRGGGSCMDMGFNALYNIRYDSSLQNNDIDELPASIGDMSALEYLCVTLR
nr:hypothetical protein HK105_007637 [Polyrhizophydium stewartii]